jgi:Tfp pilus assembly protein PilN
MDRVDLDFVAKRHRPDWSAWALLLTGALVLALVVAWQHFDRDAEIAARRAQLNALQTALEAKRPTAARLDDKQLASEWTRAIGVAGELNQPWDKLFAVLEKDVNRPVALLTLEPDAAKHELMLTAEAKNFDEMLAYYRYLQQQEMLSSVVLHAHQVNQQDKERPINFRITANWVAKP